MNWVERHKLEKYTSRNQAECALRVVHGSQPGLGRRWRQGVATLSPGSISFRPQWGGFRFIRLAPVTILVFAVGTEASPIPELRQLVQPRPDMLIVHLTTPTATLDWMLLPEQISWATGIVGS